ncbi:MAG: class I SAM-dependent rRNA methyltransferase, partial [Bacteroidales bacterium]|nr:class I SAM-dependent rRNA methyltransferase [Bacteroidales bacterium]
QMGIAGCKEITAWRLIHGEGDNLPGLVIDVYNDTFVVQAHSYGMYLSMEDISAALSGIFGNKLSAIYSKSASTLTVKPENPLEDRYIQGISESPAIILENGKKFLVDWINGQKTGFFLDQRDNRALVEKYSKGRRVLNLFSYTGGFSVYALAGGALSVDSVDSSRTVGDIIGKNIELNRDSGIIPSDSEHSFFCNDVNNFLKGSEKGKYDLIIVDPPAYAKHRDSVSNALRGYQRLNASVIEKISPGGLIFTFSCSQAVDRNAFALTVFSAAAQVGRSVRIVGRMTQPADHPVNIFHPEGEYLKGLILHVE